MSDMTHLNVKIPAPVHQAIRVTAAQQGVTLRHLVEAVLRDAAAENLAENATLSDLKSEGVTSLQSPPRTNHESVDSGDLL